MRRISYEESINDMEDDNRLIIDEQAGEYCNGQEGEYCEREPLGSHRLPTFPPNIDYRQPGERNADYRQPGERELSVRHVETIPSGNAVTSFNSYHQGSTHLTVSDVFGVPKNSLDDATNVKNVTANDNRYADATHCTTNQFLPRRVLPINRSLLNLNQAYHRQSTDDEEHSEIPSDCRFPPVTYQHPSPLSETIAEDTSETFFPSPGHTGDFDLSLTEEKYFGGYGDEMKQFSSFYKRGVTQYEDSVYRGRGVPGQFPLYQSRVELYREKDTFREVDHNNDVSANSRNQTPGECNYPRDHHRDNNTYSPKQNEENEMAKRAEKIVPNQPNILNHPQNSLFSCHLCDHVGMS